jgi:succinate dehydrogenase / fumarate reductase cytochrome b subunit
MGEPIFGYGQVLYIIRTVLFIALVAHVVSAVLLTKQDVDGRPTRYVAGRKNVQASFASLTLRWGGLALFFFIIFHLMQLTLGTITPDFRPDDAYHNVIVAFSSLPVVVVYLAAMFCLAAHLFHGVWSAFQTLGLNDRRTDRLFRVLAVASAVLLFVGFSSVPVAVLLGWVS